MVHHTEMPLYSAEVWGYLDKLKTIYNRRRGKQELLLSERNEVAKRLAEKQAQMELHDKEKTIFDVAAEEARELARVQAEKMITKSLRSVFGPDYEFIIEAERLRDRTEFSFLVSSSIGGGRVTNAPEDGRGGGIVDTVALAFFSLMNAGTQKEGIVFLDEPGKFVSEGYGTDFAQLVKSISEDLDRQILMITHNGYLSSIAEIAYHIEKIDGISHATRIDGEDAGDDTLLGLDSKK